MVSNLADFSFLFAERLGDHLNLRLNHIGELDLTDNLLSDWTEVCSSRLVIGHLKSTCFLIGQRYFVHGF